MFACRNVQWKNSYVFTELKCGNPFSCGPLETSWMRVAFQFKATDILKGKLNCCFSTLQMNDYINFSKRMRHWNVRIGTANTDTEQVLLLKFSCHIYFGATHIVHIFDRII